MNETTQKAIESARRLWARHPVIFDTETTGLDGNSEIVEISAVDTDQVVLIDTLVKPTRSVPREASQIHGLRDVDLVDAPGIEQVMWELASVCRGRHLAAYNFDYDHRLLEQSAGAINRPDLFRAFQVAATGAGCIMRIYAQYRGEINATYGDFRWHRLDVAAEQCAIKVGGQPHRALTDALTARAVLKQMAEAEMSR